MKHKFLKKLIVASIVTSTIVTVLAPVGASATWTKNDNGNWIYKEGYSYATGWRYIYEKWYFFDDIGQMKTGWIQSDGEWYYLDLSGVMQTGVIQIEGKIHLFSQSGAMQNGKCIINGEVYDFDDNGVFIGTNYPIVTKGFDYYGNSTITYVPSQIVDEEASMSSDIPTDGSEQVIQYKVKFKDPDATDDEDELLKTRTVDEDTKMTLYKPSKSGYTFIEWNTDEDGDDTSYDYDDVIKVRKNITLYAQWEEEEDDSTDEDVIEVESIVVSSANASAATTVGGTLIMAKIVSPNTADNQLVTWNVSNGTGEATISNATGTRGYLTGVKAGTVTVTATATDGSEVTSNKFVVTIT